MTPTDTDLNTPAVVSEFATEQWPEGNLPEQGFSRYVSLLPGIDVFQLPMTLPQCWGEPFTAKDPRPNSPTSGKDLKWIILKLTKDAPLVIVEGVHKDETMTVTMSNLPRNRGSKDKPVYIHDLGYLLEIGLGDKSRPTTPDALKSALNHYAGRQVKIEHGLSAQCRKDKVRYIYQEVTDDNTGAVSTINALDPKGTMGCGARFYTKDFKDEKGYSDQIQCDCGAALRGFPSVERFLPMTAPAK